MHALHVVTPESAIRRHRDEGHRGRIVPRAGDSMMRTSGDAVAAEGGHNEGVSAAANWGSGLIAGGRRLAADRRAPVAAASTLAVLAAAQALWVALSQHASGTGGLLLASAWPLGSIVLVLPSMLGTLPLGFMWNRSAAAALLICAANFVSLATFRILPVAALVAQLIVIYRVGRHGPQLLAACLALPFLTLALADLAPQPAAAGWPGDTALAILAVALGPAAACTGAALRSRSEGAQRTAANEAFTKTLLENTARGERARIAHELHDVVAHHVSMIAVQAETARLATPGMPVAGAQRLSAIGDTARAALAEMRQLLGVLRVDTAETPGDRRPQPGLAQLNELLDEARGVSDIGARLIVRGWLTTLDPGVELAAYRIVQEALTNARRHAPGAAVDVELDFADDALHLRIRDNGPGPPGQPGRPAAGHGLLGMQERAAAVGGSLSTGAAPGGGFLVRATLPRWAPMADSRADLALTPRADGQPSTAGSPGADPRAGTTTAEVAG
jgi:signal transduction histidine kinase